MFGRRPLRAAVFLITTATLVASTPCFCLASQATPRAPAHACCPNREQATQRPAPHRPGEPLQEACPHCVIGHVLPSGRAVSPSATAAAIGVIDLPRSIALPLHGTREQRDYRPRIVVATHLFVLFRSLLL